MFDKPYVVVYVTASADGKISTKKGFSKFSCRYDLIRLHKARAEVDAIMVGANTVIRDNPLLTIRYVEASKQPIRVVIDGKLRIPINSRIIKNKTAKTIIFTSLNAPKDKVTSLINEGIDVIKLGKGPILKIREVLQTLMNNYNVKKVLIEGGGTLLWYVFKENVVDEFRITISPYIVGGVESVSVVLGEGFNSERDIFKLRLIKVEVCRCGNEIHLIYKPKT